MQQAHIRFILKIFLFAIPIIILLGLVEYRVHAIENNYSVARRQLEQRLDSIEILILGNSQAQRSIIPKIINNKTYNLANAMQSVDYDVALLQKYINRMPKLKAVLLLTAYPSFGVQIADSPEEWRIFFYYHYWGISNKKIHWYDLRTHSLTAFYTNSSALQSIWDKRTNYSDIDRDGWLYIDSTYRFVSWNSGEERAKLHNGLMSNQHYKENYASLEKAISLLQQRHIKVVLFNVPVTEYYSHFWNPACVQRNDSMTTALSHRYHIPYYNYQHDKRFDDHCFFDNDHMNVAGAIKFTKLIKHDFLDSLLIRPGAF